MQEEERLSLREAADALGVSEVTARRWIKSGKLKASQPGRKYLIPGSAVDELLESESPKDQRRSSPQPSLLNGLEGERRASDFEAAARGLELLCEHWEQRLDAGDLDYRSLKEFFVSGRHWGAMLQAALQAELIQLGIGPGADRDDLKKSGIWRAYERSIDLSVALADAGNAKFDAGLEEEKIEAEKRRAEFTLVRGRAS